MNIRHPLMAAAVLFLALGITTRGHAAVCDVDADGDVDRLDLSLILGARKTPASGPDDPRDADGDGTVTVVDARTCVRKCSLPRCVTESDQSKVDAPKTTPKQKAARETPKTDKTTSARPVVTTQQGTSNRGAGWKVKRGDTLYAIGRAIYPGDAGKQARLRQEIIELNPSVFANGANKMSVGIILKLPDYLATDKEPGKAPEPAEVKAVVPAVVAPEPTAKTVPVITPEPETQPEVVTAPKSTVEPEPEPQSQEKKQPSTVGDQTDPPPASVEGNVLVSLGYSFGGEKLEFDDGSYDPAGAGGHLRLGYEKMYRHGGYRIAIGLQYGFAADGSDITTLQDNYLQLAYQRQASSIVYGIGIVFHSGASIGGDSSADFDAATGGVVYLENVGGGSLGGLGLSYTALDIEEEDSGTSFDASRAELYYSWRF